MRDDATVLSCCPALPCQVRFKDKTPAPLGGMDRLLEAVQSRTLEAGAAVAAAQVRSLTGEGSRRPSRGLLTLTPLSSLPALLRQSSLAAAANRLSCVTTLILMLIRFRFGLGAAAAAVLAQHLSPRVVDSMDEVRGGGEAWVGDGGGGGEAWVGDASPSAPSPSSTPTLQGWEEEVGAAVAYLLRTKLAKGADGAAVAGKEGAATAAAAASAAAGGVGTAQTLSLPTETDKLKKHLTILCDRLQKGHALE